MIIPLLLIFWSLWKERNNRIFRQQELLPARSLSLIKDIRLCIFAGAKHLDSLMPDNVPGLSKYKIILSFSLCDFALAIHQCDFAPIQRNFAPINECFKSK